MILAKREMDVVLFHAYSIIRVNEPWDYYRPDGETDEHDFDFLYRIVTRG